MKQNPSFVFFGTPDISVIVLEELKKTGLIPTLIVTAPDKPQGRGLKITPSSVKQWALDMNIPVLTPHRLKDETFLADLDPNKHGIEKWDLFVVVAYGKIIPQSVLDIPKFGTLNLHPSLLPKYRGPSPIQTAILNNDKNTGVSIMLLDAQMDHGPLIVQKHFPIPEDQWPLSSQKAHRDFFKAGGELLGHTIPLWVSNKIHATEQDHSQATYSKLIQKEEARISLSDDPYINFLKIRAYDIWPRAYFIETLQGKKTKVTITDAIYHNDTLIVRKVIPEGKKEMPYEDFIRNKA